MATRFSKLLALLGLVAAPAFSATVSWTTWTAKPNATTVNGSLLVGTTSVDVSYSGEVAFAQLNGTGTNFYQPLTTFTSPPTVTNAPPADMIAIDGTATVHTITFSRPVTDPVMEVVSLGQSGTETEYHFSLSASQSVAILSQGPSNAFGGCATCLTLSGNTLTGDEGDGLLQFKGTFSTLSWTGAKPEFWNGVTVGVSGVAVPEPATWATALLGLMAIVTAAVLRRR